MRATILAIVLAMGLAASPMAHATSVEIVMDRDTFSYCEKLFYVIKVSEVTADQAIIHITDESGTKSSAIPIPITDLENQIPSVSPFQKEIFPLGKYVIDVEYSGAHAMAEFVLVDSGRACIPETIKPIMSNWLAGNISDGFLIDALAKFTKDMGLFEVPFETDETTIYDISIPQWVRNVGYWWLEEAVSDDELVNMMNNLMERGIISPEQYEEGPI